MSHLYELSAELKIMIAELDMAESCGDSEKYAAIMAGLAKIEGDMKAKIADCCMYHASLKAERAAIEAEIDRLTARAEAVGKRADNFREYIGFCLGAGNKWKNELFSLSWKKTSAVKVLDEKAIPPLYWREKVTKSVDKAAIGADLKIPGTFIPGAELEEHETLIIK